MPTPDVVVPIGYITSWLLAHGLHTLARVTTTPCSCLKPTLLHVASMAPCHIPSFSWCNNELWHCAHDSSSMHEALHPHVLHPTSCLESALLLLHLHATSKQHAMALCPWLFKPPSTRHCAFLPQLGGESASRPVPLWPLVAYLHMSWSPSAGANKAHPLCALLVSEALHFGVAMPKPPRLTLSHLLPLKEHFRLW